MKRTLYGLALAAITATPLAQAESFNYFSRSSSIGEDNVWVVHEFSEGQYVLDMHVRRWDEDSNQWTRCKKNADCNTNEGRLTFGTPIYSPIDGVVRGCWRNTPDNPAPGEKLEGINGNGDPDEIIPGAGNHLNIETPDGNLVLIAHFKQGTIPEELCPIEKTYMDHQNKSPGNGFPDEYMIDEADRPVLQKGDLLGYAGNSGNSSGPHIHIRIAPTLSSTDHGSPIPFSFKNVWAQAYDKDEAATPGGWYRFRGADFVGNPNLDEDCEGVIDNRPDCHFTMFHPSPFLKRVETGAGFVYQAKPVLLHDELAVTPLIDSRGRLKLISWKINGISEVKRLKDIGGEAVLDVHVERVHNNRLLLAVSTGSQKLRMILYRVNSDGSFVREHSYNAGTVSNLSLTKTNGRDDKFVTSLKDGNGNLKVIVWDVDYNSGYKIVRQGDAGAGSAHAIASATAQHFNGLYTAYRNNAGRLQLTPWTVSLDGQTIQAGIGYTAGAIQPVVDVTGIEQGAVVGVKDTEGELRLISFEASYNGDIVDRQETETAGAISEVKLLNPGLADSNIAAIVRDAVGKMRLIGYTMEANGEDLRRDGSCIGLKGNQFAADTIVKSYGNLDPRDLIITTQRELDGDLKITTWDTNLINP